MTDHNDFATTGQGRKSAAWSLAWMTAIGLGLGLLGFFGWRYAAPYGPIVIAQVPDVPAPPHGTVGPVLSEIVGDGGPEYVSGPPWWPMVLILPVLGALIGALCGGLMWRSGWEWVRRAHGERWPAVVTLGAVGALAGLVAAAVSTAQPPWLNVTLTAEGTPGGRDVVEGAPPHVDLGSLYVLFPSVGVAVGVLVALVVVGAGFTLTARTGGEPMTTK